MQIPSPELAAEVGVVGYLLILVVMGGLMSCGWFLRRMAQSMDRMAAAHEQAPVVLARLELLLAERTNGLERTLDEVLDVGQKNLAIARLWELTEAPERRVRSTDHSSPERPGQG